MDRRYDSGTWLQSMSLHDLQHLTIPAYYVQERWLKVRRRPPRVLPRWHADALVAMHLIRSRWLVTLSAEGQVELWDLTHHGPASRRGVMLLPGRMWTSFVAQSTPFGEAITLAATRTEAYVALRFSKCS